MLCLLLWGIKAIHHAMQPKYQGKTAGEWFAEAKPKELFGVKRDEEFAKEPSTIALQNLGTNAVWYLWAELNRKDSVWTTWGWELHDRLTKKERYFSNEEERHDKAHDLLVLMQAVPEGLTIELARRARGKNTKEARQAIGLLGRLKKHPDIAVSALIEGLQDEKRYMPAVEALIAFGSEAKPALPALRNLLAHPFPSINKSSSDFIRRAIIRTDPTAPEFKELADELKPGNMKSSIDAIAELISIGDIQPEAYAVLVRFSQTLTNKFKVDEFVNYVRDMEAKTKNSKP